MGCGSSKETGTTGPQRVQISAPVDPPGTIPQRMRDSQGVPMVPQSYDLSRQNILRAFGYVAEYLHQRGKKIYLVAVGGAVNTVHLQTRASTHDVDFFSAPLSGSQVSLLRAAIRYAEERSSVPLGEAWMNNETATIGGTREHVAELVSQASAQNNIIFNQRGLTVLCAPWHYAFVAKVGRITYGTGRPYDMQDAVHYLHQFIQAHGGTPVRSREIHAWGSQYRRATPDEILHQVENLYRRTYGRSGIAF